MTSVVPSFFLHHSFSYFPDGCKTTASMPTQRRGKREESVKPSWDMGLEEASAAGDVGVTMDCQM